MTTYTILIVEDEANQRFMLEQALWAPGKWSIATAANGHEALDRAAEQPPDLVITDYNMLEMNGIELVTQLRARGFTSYVILMTAYSSPEIKDAADRLQIDHYLAKPVALKVLRDLTAEVIARKAMSPGCWHRSKK